jgi:hypothetical protein
MNLFHRKIDNYSDNGKSQKEYENFEISADWEESYKKNKEKDMSAKEVYYPSVLMFRSLLEGTSFDRRVNKKKEVPEKPIQTESEDNPDISLQQKISTIELYPTKNKKLEKSANFYKPLKKKKFITKKEQNRLSHIVKKVLRPARD